MKVCFSFVVYAKIFSQQKCPNLHVHACTYRICDIAYFELLSCVKHCIAELLLRLICILQMHRPSLCSSSFPTAQQMTKEFRPDPSEKRYTFDDVQGIEEAKDEVKELVEFLRNPEKFQRLGAKLPTGRWKNGY